MRDRGEMMKEEGLPAVIPLLNRGPLRGNFLSHFFIRMNIDGSVKVRRTGKKCPVLSNQMLSC